MKKVEYIHKLVRDRIPEIITITKGNPVIRILDDYDYKIALSDKLREEAFEFAISTDNKEEEIADILEIIDTLIIVHNLDKKTIQKIQKKKKKENGGFIKRIFLEKIISEEK